MTRWLLNRMALLDELGKAATDGDRDFLREGARARRLLAEALMDAEVSAQIGAAHGERAPDRRVTQRNGYRAARHSRG